LQACLERAPEAPPMKAEDPVEALLARERAHDHAIAAARGRRVLDLVDSIIGELQAEGLATLNVDDARVVLFAVVADALYGNVAIDIPPLRESREK
jgi:hypothetical protein